MKISDEKKDNILVISLVGRLDANTSTQFQEKIISDIDTGETNLAIDFSQLDYISSAGLRILLMAAKKITTLHGQMVLFDLQNQIREVFDIAGFSTIFKIYQTEDEALSHIKNAS